MPPVRGKAVLKAVRDSQKIVLENPVEGLNCESECAPIDRIVGASYNSIPRSSVVPLYSLNFDSIPFQFGNESGKRLASSHQAIVYSHTVSLNRVVTADHATRCHGASRGT